MGSILDEIVQDSTLQVDDPLKPLTWHVHSISNADSTSIGTALLLNVDLSKKNDDGELDLLEAVRRMGEEGVRKNWQWMEKVVCMGVSYVQKTGDDSTREKVQLHMRADQHDPEKGVLWVGCLKKQQTETLYKAVMALSTEEGSAIERARTFRREQAAEPERAPVGEDIRGAAEPDHEDGDRGDDSDRSLLPSRPETNAASAAK